MIPSSMVILSFTSHPSIIAPQIHFIFHYTSETYFGDAHDMEAGRCKKQRSRYLAAAAAAEDEDGATEAGEEGAGTAPV